MLIENMCAARVVTPSQEPEYSGVRVHKCRVLACSTCHRGRCYQHPECHHYDRTTPVSAPPGICWKCPLTRQIPRCPVFCPVALVDVKQYLCTSRLRIMRGLFS